MRKHIKSSLFLCLGLIILSAGCKKDLNKLSVNENKPTTAPANLILTGVLTNLYDRPFSSYEVWDQYYLNNYDYYGNNRYDFGSGNVYYTTLKNVIKMEEEATKAGQETVNPYTAMGKFFRAYFFTKMSLQLGDIPMTQALKGTENLTPVYDSQKDVFKQSLTWLEEANTEFASVIANKKGSIDGDIYFGNDLSKWQKTVNSFKLRLLIELSKKENDTDLNIKQQFANIINNPTKYPIFQSSADNLQFIYNDKTNKYPNNPENYGFDNSRNNSSATYVGLLTQAKDPRVFVTNEPARYYVDQLNQSPTDFNSFVGADPGLDLGIMYSNAGLQKYSFINRKRYYSTFTAEPSVQIGYPEMCFNIAEAINRGWVSGNAEGWYIKGIQSSWDFYGIPTTGSFTAYFYKPGATDPTKSQNYNSYTVNTNWANYYLQADVKYAGNNATGINQIINQKYLAMFRHSGLEAFYNYRRTGIPNFTTGVGTGNSGRIPLRFKYPNSELTSNSDNYQSALQSQYAGKDDINLAPWIIK
ncbi:MAG: SusD/RagB family nutrient-binding outer membrane lipoprotein [Bacteroidetes bacterium]|nr:SusD/RagB family nutrient-binding outer membrane lipoprotein [Bacteroidota bacterium]MBU1372621.1 SusD/RagB family nutrient-binding outer membrane lipoprotein [Bacteroidota bacterium]MBU1484817.1 SusD/RagB family nutrient-binding outer membrane lipoprotein [Bacteroidota bacterium]MBU1759970.1 SusD/RagB family nutrient-binding outer membrane lipoprotein [Bacteroidota bacterium]MBU2047087.1 SusD/RagB family nutrient-binding outer membrane lipoprotein [Bacteroidota bacterium]